MKSLEYKKQESIRELYVALLGAMAGYPDPKGRIPKKAIETITREIQRLQDIANPALQPEMTLEQELWLRPRGVEQTDGDSS